MPFLMAVPCRNAGKGDKMNRAIPERVTLFCRYFDGAGVIGGGARGGGGEEAVGFCCLM